MNTFITTREAATPRKGLRFGYFLPIPLSLFTFAPPLYPPTPPSSALSTLRIGKLKIIRVAGYGRGGERGRESSEATVEGEVNARLR